MVPGEPVPGYHPPVPAKRSGVVYRVHYAKEKEPLCEILARQVGPADILGFIEISDFVAPRPSGRILRPDADRVEREFEGVRRTFVPISDVRRIDAIDDSAMRVESSALKVVELKPR